MVWPPNLYNSYLHISGFSKHNYYYTYNDILPLRAFGVYELFKNPDYLQFCYERIDFFNS